MSVVSDLLQDVELAATLRNGDVVAAALHNLESREAQCCNYVGNRERFAAALRVHKLTVIALSRAMKEQPDPYSSRLRALIERSTVTRAALRAMWPCPACIDKYNPTNKQSYMGMPLKESVI